MNRPFLSFKKTHIPSGATFEDKFSAKNCANFKYLTLCELENKGKSLVEHWNASLPGVWKYELLDWSLESKDE
jgi:hypothetical protein